jgi:hypothetical protein
MPNSDDLHHKLRHRIDGGSKAAIRGSGKEMNKAITGASGAVIAAAAATAISTSVFGKKMT